MPLSRCQACVPALLHDLQQLSHLPDSRARAHAQAQGIAAETLIGARLAADMLPLAARGPRRPPRGRAGRPFNGSLQPPR